MTQDTVTQSVISKNGVCNSVFGRKPLSSEVGTIVRVRRSASVCIVLSRTAALQINDQNIKIKMRLLIVLALLGVTMAENDWHPILPEPTVTYSYHGSERALETRPQLKIVNRRPIQSSQYVSPNKISLFNPNPSPMTDTCSVYKVSMNQELFYQYVEYERDLPDLKEFTLCMWKKFHNHSNDHPLFSYSVGDNPKEISAWISNTEEASYFSMAVHGQTFFRLNYPLKLNTWYHSCQSWNGKTGEWQIWVNAERVGRGFHNRLVGHVIKGGGLAISGQDQSLLYKKDIEPVQRQSGLMGEITMLQLYHVALTAGKAHKDHKHHHVHHFRHDGTPLEASTEAATEPPPPQATPLGNGNFLIGGQLQRAPQLNLAGAQQMVPVQLPNGLQLQQEYANGQFGNRLVSEQLLNSVQPMNLPLIPASIPQVPYTSIGQAQGFPRQSLGPSKSTTVVLSGSLLNPANVKYIDDSVQHNLFKRDSKRDKRDNPEKELKEELSSVSGKKDKRGLVALSDGSIVDEALLSPDPVAQSEQEEEMMFQQSLLNGLAGFVGNLPVQNLQKETVDEREPAEAEVKAVMEVCSGCAREPFKKALVISWRATPKKLYSGAHYYKGLPICRAF
ncbi:pentraxin-related protein b6 [Anticarsia gemmatalis]|uniref:pentraxin-related protein b6 n=1 Tax=Anticarsia gemmatalis TaxID=129554 RepID=UPI003F774AB0